MSIETRVESSSRRFWSHSCHQLCSDQTVVRKREGVHSRC